MQTIVAVLLLAAFNDVGISTTPTETPSAKPAKPKKICRSYAVTGSRVTSKVCKTQAEWDVQTDMDFDKLKQLGNKDRVGN